MKNLLQLDFNFIEDGFQIGSRSESGSNKNTKHTGSLSYVLTSTTLDFVPRESSTQTEPATLFEETPLLLEWPEGTQVVAAPL